MASGIAAAGPPSTVPTAGEPSAPATPAPAHASLEGVWKLVEQRYETGDANLLAPETTLRLEFRRVDGELAGRLQAAGSPGFEDLPWPAFANESGPLAVALLERRCEASGAFARYRVRPSGADDLVLDVTEDYAVSPGGDELTGRLSVAFTGGETNRGGFVLTRRFAREP